MKFLSVQSHFVILNNFLSHLGNLGHPCEFIVTLVVPSYLNIPMVHSSPSPSKMNSKLSFQTVTMSFHVDLATTWQWWRYFSIEHHYHLDTCRNNRIEPHPSVSLLLKIVINTGWTHWFLLLRDHVSWEISVTLVTSHSLMVVSR